MRLWWLSLQSVLDEMMVEQTDLVRLRMVRMSNVPDTLYMVNNAVPQCCWTETPSVLHKPPRAACQCFPARSLAGWERQQAWHVPGWGEWI